MKRSLVMLLVVALLAMMVPSFALAEGAPSIALSTSTYTQYLRYYDDEDDPTSSYTGITFTVSNFVDEEGDSKSGYVEFSSSDYDVVSFGYSKTSTTRYVYGSGTYDVPELYFWAKEGAAKITGNFTDYEGHNYGSVTLDVTVTKAKTEKIEVDSSRPVSAFEMTMGAGSSSFRYCFKVTPESAFYDHDFKWSISDPTIARVDKNGNVTALKAGTVGLTATAKDNAQATATCNITIKEAEKKEEIAPTLTFSTDKFNLKLKDDGMYLSNYLLVENLSDEDSILFSSSNPKLINVSSSGYLYLKLPGTVTITARSMKFKDAVAKCEVTLDKEALNEIRFTGIPTALDCGDSLDPWNYMDTDPYYYATSNSDEIGWASSDPQVAYYDDGYIYTRAVGTATISAFYKEDETKRAEFTLEVKAVPVSEIVFNKEAYTLKAGYTATLSKDKDYRLKPINATSGYTTTWTSSDEEIATVYGGSINAWKAGTATITMSVRNVDDTIVEKAITVTVTEDALSAIAFKKDAYTVKLSNDKHYKFLRLALTPADADVDWDELYAESSDPKVATASISEGGVDVRAVAPGTATITVVSRANPAIAPATTTVTVKPITLTSVAFEDSAVTVPVYEDGKGAFIRVADKEIKAIIKPSDAYCKATWETSDASVAVVNGDEDGRYGNIIPIGPGTCQIILTVTDGTNTMTAQIPVTVKAAKITKLALNKTKATVYMIKGEENKLQLIATDSKTGAEAPVTWSTNNKKVATVDKTGLVYFKGAGTAKITATTKDGNNTKKTCTLTVKKLAVTSVKAASKTLSMKVGATKALVVTVKPTKAFNPAVSYKSSDAKIVSVDAKGNLKALKAGKATITITAKDGSKKSAKVTVTVTAANKKNNEAVEIAPVLDGDLAIEGDLLDNSFDIDVAGEEIVIADDEAIELNAD